MRVVLDTNVLLSGLAYPASAPGRIVAAWRSGAFEVVLSPYLLDELSRVIPRLDHRLKLSRAERGDLIDSLALSAEMIVPDAASLEVAAQPGLLRDTGDIPVLALLIAARADYLITGDGDLLTLVAVYSIVTPAEFEARYAP